MPRNIIICCDGTGNQFDESYSNVVKLFKIASKDKKTQLCYYDPGVGTVSDERGDMPRYWKLKNTWSQITGTGLEKNVKEAYSYLMDHYEPGDRIFLFGFSRGAYTIRVLAGLLSAAGLLEKGNQNMLSYAWMIYRMTIDKNKRQLVADFKATFSRDVTVHFLGLWDTVTSMGIFNWRRYPRTTNNYSVLHVRHAMAIDERRTFFRQNLFGKNDQDGSIKQVWFAGVHSDVGGSYPFDESGLAQITLEWMLREAKPFGLLTDPIQEDIVLKDALKKGYSLPDYKAAQHESLTGLKWRSLELIPQLRFYPLKITRPGLGRCRELFKTWDNQHLTPAIHVSVKHRLLDNQLNYKPKNLNTNDLAKCTIED